MAGQISMGARREVVLAVAGRSSEERVAVTVICWVVGVGWRVRTIEMEDCGDTWTRSD